MQSFLGFLASEGGPKLTIAKSRQDPAAQKRQLQADIRECRKRLHRTHDVVEARALIAVLIARKFTLPLSRVLSLKRFEVAVSPTAVTLWKDGEALTLDEPLAHAFREWISLGGPGVRQDTRGSSPVETGSSPCPRPQSRIIWPQGQEATEEPLMGAAKNNPTTVTTFGRGRFSPHQISAWEADRCAAFAVAIERLRGWPVHATFIGDGAVRLQAEDAGDRVLRSARHLHDGTVR